MEPECGSDRGVVTGAAAGSEAFDPRLGSIVDVLQYRAARQGEDLAYTFLRSGQHEAERLTYGELGRRASLVAAALRSYPAGARALLLFPAGLEFLCAFFGCAYAGVVSVPVPSPEAIRLKRTLPRLRAVTRDAQPAVVLCSEQNIEPIRELWAEVPELRELEVLTVGDCLTREQEPANSGFNRPRPDDTIYLQYTSGSTGTPKGVVVTHRNLMCNLLDITKAWQQPEGGVSVNWMPYFHDFGLVEGLIHPLYANNRSYVLSPIAFIKRPICWLQAITRYRATHSCAPTFAYDFCVHRTRPEERAGLDLQSWKVAGLGAERISERTITAFADIYRDYGFNEIALRPSYGLAEATLMVTTRLSGTDSSVLQLDGQALEQGRIVLATAENGMVRRIVGCGRVLPSSRVLIVDPVRRTVCKADQVGEIWISGPSVAGGYWRRAEETESTFRVRLAETGEGPFLRTGDLGFVNNGEVFVTGRIKDLIIVRGTNHHPEDIENTVCACVGELAGHSGAAFATDVGGEERLVVVYEIKSRSISRECMARMADAARKAIAEEHDLRLYALSLVRPGSFPKTSSGKIQRQTCRQHWLAGELQVTAEWRQEDYL